MKKLLFTALAVVAFSGVAMADTKVVEIKEDEVVFEDCTTSVMNYIDNVYDKDGTHSAAQNYDAYQAYLAGCQSKEKSITAA